MLKKKDNVLKWIDTGLFKVTVRCRKIRNTKPMNNNVRI